MPCLVRAADADAIRFAADLLRQGKLVAFPTETVYGLGVHALDRDAVRRLFEAKGRPAHDPLIVHVSSLEAAAPLVTDIPDEARQLAAHFWPGPLTMVLARSAAVPDEVTAGLDTVAIRVPAHPVARALLEAAGIPVAAPSANLFSRPSPTRADHVVDDLGDRIDLVLDGGQTTVGLESTVIHPSSGQIIILRPGGITREMLSRAVPNVAVIEAAANAGGALRSPGLLEKHYSPKAPLTLYTGSAAASTLADDARRLIAEGRAVGIVAVEDDRDQLHSLDAARVVVVGSTHDLDRVAVNLYASIRELDAAGVDVILMRELPADGIGAAIRDRLRRAAARIVI